MMMMRRKKKKRRRRRKRISSLPELDVLLPLPNQFQGADSEVTRQHRTAATALRTEEQQERRVMGHTQKEKCSRKLTLSGNVQRRKDEDFSSLLLDGFDEIDVLAARLDIR
jgi:hypothetical protein